MLLTNSQNNIERSAIDASLQYSSSDALASKAAFRTFSKTFGSTLTYSSADNLIYYIGYEDYPHDITERTDTRTEITNIDLSDSSSYENEVLKRGNVYISPAEHHSSSFNGSAKFDGNGDYLELSADSSREIFEIGGWKDGEFTVEFWVKPTNLDNLYNYQTVFAINSKDRDGDYGPSEVASTFEISIGATRGGWTKGKVHVKGFKNEKIANAIDLNLSSTTILSEGTWYHVAIVKKFVPDVDPENSYRVDLYIDGVSEANQNWRSNVETEIWDGSQWRINEALGGWYNKLYIGRQTQISENGLETPTAYFDGYLNEMRVSQLARYTANFTVPTSPFVATPNNSTYSNQTKLLIQSFDEVDGSVDITDSSPEKHSITINGAAHSNDYDQWGAGSTSGLDKSRIKFDSSGDSLKIPHSDDFNLLESEKTSRIDLWLYNPTDSWIPRSDANNYFDVNVILSKIRWIDGNLHGWWLTVDKQGYLSLEVRSSPSLLTGSVTHINRSIKSKNKLGAGRHFVTVLCASGYQEGVVFAAAPQSMATLFVDGEKQGEMRVDDIAWAVTSSPSERSNKDDLVVGGAKCRDQSASEFSNHFELIYMDDIKWSKAENKMSDITDPTDCSRPPYCNEIIVTHVSSNQSSTFTLLTDTHRGEYNGMPAWKGLHPNGGGTKYIYYSPSPINKPGLKIGGGYASGVYYPAGWFYAFSLGGLAHLSVNSGTGGCPASLSGHYWSSDTYKMTWGAACNIAIRFRYFDPNRAEQFLPPEGQFSSEPPVDTSLLLHLDATKKDISVTTISDGNYGLCTFNPLTLQTENVHKFSKPQYRSSNDGMKREYSLPRDIVYSPYDNSLHMLFHEHIQQYSWGLVVPDIGDYGGGGGWSDHSFSSSTSFKLFTYSIKTRSITEIKSLWSAAWTDDEFQGGYNVGPLHKETPPGLGSDAEDSGWAPSRWQYPRWLRSMYTGLSNNPRSGEVIALHSRAGWGYTNATRTLPSDTVEGSWNRTWTERLETLDEGGGGLCPTSRKCISLPVSQDMPFWRGWSRPAVWGLRWSGSVNSGARQHGELPELAPTGNFYSNNCMYYLGNNGGSPRKLIFCPSTGSHYMQASDTGIDFIYEDSDGNKKMSPDGYVKIGEALDVTDGIYIPSQDRMLYVSRNGILFYVLPCNPDLDHLAYPCDTADVTNAQLTKNIPSNTAESLIYCPSNDRIYVLCHGILLKVRPDDLEIEETYTAPTDFVMSSGGKSFIPIYSHINDTIYYMSNYVSKDSFLFEPNY
jgi:hypothetical protein